jgi:KaiC/GvpD/RAD55 family RecA-like ATPase
MTDEQQIVVAPEELVRAVRRQLAESNGQGALGGLNMLDPYIDWPEFWAHDHAEQEWLYEPILAPGRSHVIYAKRKAGKSLFALWIACELAKRSDVIVIYLDYEQSEDDLYERLVEFGYDEDTDLSRLRYALLPELGPLDEPGAGPAALHALVDAEIVAHPDAHIVVIIDTLGRAVTGSENDNDTYRAYWTHTGIGLKRRGVTTLRLDHEGKDATRGQRGGSSKGDDPDVIWRLTPGDQGGRILTRDAARMVWVPEKVGVVRLDDPFRYGLGLAPTPAGTKDLADELDRLGVPSTATVRECRTALKANDRRAASDVLAAAVKYRKTRPQ